MVVRSRRDEILNQARNALETAHRQVHWIDATLRVLESEEELRRHSPWKETYAAILDASRKARAGYTRLGQVVSEAAVSFDRKEARSAAERATVEAEILGKQHDLVVDARRRWRAERATLELSLANAFSEVDAALSVLDEEGESLEELADFLAPNALEDAQEQLEAMESAGHEVLGRRREGRLPLSATFAEWEHVREDAAKIRTFVRGADKRKETREAEGGRSSRYALQGAKDRLFLARRSLRTARTRLADPDVRRRRGATLLSGLVQARLPVVEALYTQCEAALASGGAVALRETEEAVDESLFESVEDAAEIDGLFQALEGAGSVAAHEVVARVDEDDGFFEEDWDDDLEDDESEVSASEPTPRAPTSSSRARRSTKPLLDWEPEAVEDEPAIVELENSDGAATSDVPPAPAPKKPTLREATASRVADFDWDSILSGEEDAAIIRVAHPAEVEPLLAWAGEIEKSGLPLCVQVADDLRDWVLSYEEQGEKLSAQQALARFQAQLTASMEAAIAELPEPARVWESAHPRRVSLARWHKKHRGRGHLAPLIRRVSDADKLMGQLDLDLSMIGMERDLRVLRSVWTRVTYSPSLLEGLMRELKEATPGTW